MDNKSVTNDLIKIINLGVPYENQPNALIMNKKTLDLILQIDQIPSARNSNSITLFGLTVFDASEYLPNDVIGIANHSYALGYTLVANKEPYKAREILAGISKVAVQGEFTYEDIQYIGLTGGDTPSYSPNLKYPMWEPNKKNDEITQNKYDENRPYANKYDLPSTVDYINDVDRASASAFSDLVYVLNQNTANDIALLDGLPSDFINHKKQTIRDKQIIYINTMPDGIIALMPLTEAISIRRTLDKDLAYATQYSMLLILASKPGIFNYQGNLFIKLKQLNKAS